MALALHPATAMPPTPTERGGGCRHLPHMSGVLRQAGVDLEAVELSEHVGHVVPLDGDVGLELGTLLAGLGELAPVDGGHLPRTIEEPTRQCAIPAAVVAGQVVPDLLGHDVGRGARGRTSHPPRPVARIFGVGSAEPPTVQLDRGGGSPLLCGLVGEEKHDRLGHGERITGKDGGNLALIHLSTSNSG